MTAALLPGAAGAEISCRNDVLPQIGQLGIVDDMTSSSQVLEHFLHLYS